MRIIPSSLLVLAFLLSMQGARAFAESPTAQEADELYQNGDCPKALRAYAQIDADSQAAPDLKERGLFRTGYCYLQTERAAESAKAFAAFLKIHPENEELPPAAVPRTLRGVSFLFAGT